VFEAFSRVVQKLMPEQQYSTLENLLNDLISNSNMEKTFLFDVVSKIYIATDSNPVDMHSYELCSDMIDVVKKLGGIGSSIPRRFVCALFVLSSAVRQKVERDVLLALYLVLHEWF